MPPIYYEITINNVTFSCRSNILEGMSSVFQGDHPFNYVFPIFLLQVSIACILTSTTKFLLEPFGQTSFVSQLIGGMLAGPSFLGKTKIFRDEIFHRRTFYIFETFQYFGFMYFLFLVGVKTDLSIVRKTGKKAWIIGLSCYFLPLFLTLSVAYVVKNTIKLDPNLANLELPRAASLLSLSSFHVLAVFLSDLKLLNSELGRLAMSASLISGLCSWVSGFLFLAIRQSSDEQTKHVFPWIIFFACVLFLSIIYLLRPMMFWMIRHTPEHKNIKEGYVLFIFVMVLVSSFFGEVLGQHFLIGPMILGLAVPVGPPLGSVIEEKLECFVTVILLPMLIISASSRIDIFQIGFHIFGVVGIVILFSFIGKLTGTVLPALYCRMPYQDALLLGAIMNVQGVLDLEFWLQALRLKLLSPEVYGVLMVGMILITGTISPLVRNLYDPSSTYKAYKRRSLENSKQNIELRILACIYQDENVPTIIEILEASNPTTFSPICVYVVHLIQLLGRASPLLIAHKRNLKNTSNFNPSARIINAFRYYEDFHRDRVNINCFTAMSPYSTMHDDICSLGLERRTTLILVPFHYQPSISTALHSPISIRKVNLNILEKAPCSVGILIDRGSGIASSSAMCVVDKRCSFRVAVIFLGGGDDREALAYGVRMAEDVNHVNLTVIRFRHIEEKVGQITNEEKLDDDAINEFRFSSRAKDNVLYKDEVVKDGIDLISAMKLFMTSFQLYMVGRQHDGESLNLLEGLDEWNEFPELGVIGDLLASSDSDECNGSVLVVQQQWVANKSSLLGTPKYQFELRK